MPNTGTRIGFALIGALALAGLSGCGSGSMTCNCAVAGTIVTALFQGATMPTAVAYQAGATGKFQTLTLSGSTASFRLPEGTTAYGFAYQCPTFVSAFSFSNESIIQATTADTTTLSLACPSASSGNVSATFDASAIPGVTSVALYAGSWSNDFFGASVGSVELSGIPTGTLDVALVATGANGALAVQIQRGVNVTSSTSIAFPPMTAADELGAAPASVTNVPSGTTGGFTTRYNTSGGLSIVLSGLFNGMGQQSSYPTVPSSQSQPGDFYLLDGGVNLPTQPSESLTALASSSTAGAVTLALPSASSSLAAPTAATFPTFNANTSGFTVAGTVVDSAWTQFQTPAVNRIVYNLYIYVTKTWLGTSTTFTVPDLSAFAGFAPAPPSGGPEFWTLYSTAGTPLQFIPVQQSGAEALTSSTSVQSSSTRGVFTVP